ncbi:MAG: helix-turn-helix transcriptional regulator [Gammaproteobacteria bacterium]
MANTSFTAPSERDIFYFRTRCRNRFYQAVVAYFALQAQEKGLTQAELAKLLGKDAAQINRWLSGPGNWTLDTISDLLLAMNAELDEPHVISFDEERSDARSATNAQFFDRSASATAASSAGRLEILRTGT